ncbi:MAG TPA: antibiotic biosynthesis monooxygenase [Leptolyngbyaceae cyanobacterium]
MVKIDRTNTMLVGLDLYTVAERHQPALIEAVVQQQIKTWIENPYFVSASVHRSLDGVRVFTYSQWNPKFDHRSLPRPTALSEFFPPDSLLLEVTASRSLSAEVEIAQGKMLTHLAEFRMIPVNQPEMVRRTSAELERAIANSPGLLSATFHRSLDGTRMFNYGQWESKEAFEAILKQPGFNPEQPYWEGLARNEFHLYNVVHIQSMA